MSEFKQYSLAEVAKHNSNKSVWFVIHNNIYDVTEFLNEVSDSYMFCCNQIYNFYIRHEFHTLVRSLDKKLSYQ